MSKIEHKLLKAMSYICVAAAIFFESKRLYYATDMWAYSEMALVLLATAAILSLIQFGLEYANCE